MAKQQAKKPAKQQETKQAKHSPKAPKPGKTKQPSTKQSSKPTAAPHAPQLRDEGTAEVLRSDVVYDGRLFQVLKEEVREPNGHVGEKEIIRHNGSVVILAADAPSGKKKRSKSDPILVMERQYRHAAGQYLWELPAGRIEPGEDRLPAARRELAEETGYTAGHWTELVRYYASPGFLGEWMQIFLAEDLTAGTARPEADETLEIYPVPLSEVWKLIDAGQILDGKTLIAVAMYTRLLAARGNTPKKKRKHNSKKP
jgi:ADP-ribose pyrophosphatase